MAPHLPRTILVIDDELSVVRALTGLLRRDGYRVATARPKYSEATVRGNIIPPRCFINMFLLLPLRDLDSFTAPWEILFGDNIAENDL